MQDEVNVSVVQLDCAWLDRETNARRMAEYSLAQLRAAGATAQMHELPGLVSFPEKGELRVLSPREIVIEANTLGHSVPTLPDGISKMMDRGHTNSCGACHNVPYRDGGAGMTIPKNGGAGRNQMFVAAMSAVMGGNVRVGLEDSLWLGRGTLAKTNAEQVAKIRRILEELGLQIATPDEAREMLKLKGGRNVAF